MLASFQVSRLRLLGDYVHSTCIAFVEFTQVSRTRHCTVEVIKVLLFNLQGAIDV
jgi:hypothetical protein